MRLFRICPPFRLRLWLLVLPCHLLLIGCLGGEGFTNSDGTAINKPLADLLKWRLGRRSPKPSVIDSSEAWRQLTPETSHYAVWVGHASFLIDNGDVTILTDPIFSSRASPVSWAGPQRLVEPAIPARELPPVDVVTISHNHYDHLDLPSLRAIQELNPDCLFLVPLGDRLLLEQAGIRRVEEYDWWQERRVSRTLFTFTPTRHWSARGLFDRNQSRWGGWFMRAPDYALFHAGDTGYSQHDFTTIRARLGAPNTAFIPIGAYAPRWFMRAAHINPSEALQVARDLGAKRSLAMHWGTFMLTDEPVLEPAQKLALARQAAGYTENFFRVPALGGINWLMD